MHRGRVILGAVLGGAITVAVATQVASWSPDPTGWDGYSPTGPTIEPTPEPMPADYTMPPECQEEWDAALRDGRVREAQETGATVFAVACRLGSTEPCVPERILVEEPGRSPEYVERVCD